MKTVIVMVAVLLLLVSCATLPPFSRQDYQQIGKILEPCIARWGQYAYIEVHLQMGREGWIGFLWFNKDHSITHVLVLAYFGEWTVVREE